MLLDVCNLDRFPDPTEIDRFPYPAWQRPILEFLLEMEFTDDEIDDVLGYLTCTGRTRRCPHLKESHRSLVADMIPNYVRPNRVLVMEETEGSDA